ncbi:MAG: ATP-binding protein [Polyangiaceae bacterium]
MSQAPFDEAARLRLLDDYGVMDTAPDPVLDEIVALASAICETPIALVSLVDDTRQWFKARVGLEAQQTPRDVAFCAHVIVADDDGVFAVPDARTDPRFSENPLVKGDPNVVFYAGAPLTVEGGAKLGTLCVIDTKPHQLTAVQEQALTTLSKLVVKHLQYRRELAEGLASEARLAAVLTSIGDAVVATDREGQVTFLNPVAERLMGWSSAEATGKNIHDTLNLIQEQTRETARNPLDRALAEGRMIGIANHTLLVRRDGTEIPIDDNAAPVRNVNGLVTGAVLVFRDITEERTIMTERAKLFDEQRVARENAEKATHAMDQFLATVSHELRTPLNAILGWTRLLQSEQIQETQRAKALATIERNAVAQAQLINDLLDVSRIISGKMRLDLVPVELVSVVEAALDVVRPAAAAKDVALRALIDPGASHVTGDSARLQQVTWNLLSNAVKFTPKGGHVEVQLVRVESFIELAVTDNGAGIAADFLPHVFERFRQADGASTRSNSGLGLGLAITKNIVELHGGTIRVESAGLGKGASFIVRLPMSSVRAEDARRRVADHPKVEGELPFDCPPEIVGLKILVVDDEEDAREMLVTMLRQCHALVESAGSVAEAMITFERELFAVIISDLGMPSEDGYSLIKRVRTSAAPKASRTPVVALTAYARAEDRTRALRAGFNSHVAKPIEPSELLAVIASLVERTSDY